MAESSNGGNNPGQQPKEMSMETRLLLAFILMGAVMFLTPYFFPSANPPAKKGTQPQQTAQTAQPAPPVAAETAPPPEAVAPAPQSAATSPITRARQEPPLTIDTDLLRVTFNNQGANVRSWLLKKHKAAGKPLELVNAAAVGGVEDPYPLSLYLPEQKPLAKKLNWAFYTQTPDPDRLGVAFEFSDGHTTVRKTLRFVKNSYLAQITSEVATDGRPVPHMLEWRGGFGDLSVTNPYITEQTVHFDLSVNKLVEQNGAAAKNGPIANAGNFSFAGIEDKYFAALFLPQGNAAMQQVTFADFLTVDNKSVPYAGAAVSMGDVNRFELFVGPKDYDELKRINPRLEQVVNFGSGFWIWLSPLTKVLFLIVNWLNDNVVHSFGWAIVLITVVINFMLFPLKLTSMKSMRKMQALKPQIDIINAKYKSIKMTDPRAGEKNQEVMELYKKHGVNPMGGCLPMVLQIPFFAAFYRVFTVSVEMRGAGWLWVPDLSQAEPWDLKVLPIVMIVSQFAMQKMTPQPQGDPNQQKMMMFMPLIFGFMFYRLPSGLVLYYLTSNLVSMGQQWFFNHTEAALAAARSVEPPKKKNSRK